MKKRILVFSTTYALYIGGAEIALQHITENLPMYEFDIVTVDLEGGHKKEEHDNNVHIYRVGRGKLGKILFPLRAFIKGVLLHRRFKYDLVWSMMASYAGFAGLFFSYTFPQIPFVLTLQEGDTHEELKKKFRFVSPIFKKVFTRPSIIQAISTYLEKFASSMGAQHTVVVPNGVEVALFEQKDESLINQIRNEYGIDDGFVLVTTSRLVRKNAVGDIVSAVALLPEDTKLLIVGNGNERSYLEDAVRNKGLEDRVFFVGEKRPEDIIPYLHCADVFIRPSLSEGFGNSFIEAMATKTPVIATPVGGIVDFLVDNKTGLLCKVQNPQSIAEKVTYIRQHQDEKENIIENAYQLVKEKYDWSIISRKMQTDVFEVVLKDGS